VPAQRDAYAPRLCGAAAIAMAAPEQSAIWTAEEMLKALRSVASATEVQSLSLAGMFAAPTDMLRLMCLDDPVVVLNDACISAWLPLGHAGCTLHLVSAGQPVLTGKPLANPTRLATSASLGS
jgi:hypothetical protein